MTEKILISLCLIILLGVGAEWLGWRFHFPALILFLIFGFIAGPVTGVINTDEIMGNLLMPVVSFSVAIILFEGGLSLRLSELASVAKAVRNLITIGVIVSWLIISAAAYFLIGLNIQISLLLGAILVVTGPTAIGPLLKHMQLIGRVGSIVKWEGIMIAPSGALLAVLVFEAVVLSREFDQATELIVLGFVKTILVGLIVGILGATLITILLKRNWIPEFLQNATSLMMVMCVYMGSNLIQTKSGLLSVVVMGIALANQKFANIKQIVKFKEDLRVLLIPSLFIILAARLDLGALSYINLNSILFFLVVLFIARPLSVLASVNNLGLNWKEVFFLSWLGPRGIVAAAVSSVFALNLEELGISQTEYIVPITFMVIIFSVAIVGMTAAPLAKYLKLSDPNPQGVVIAGAHEWARSIGLIFKEEEFRVMLIDSNRENITNAKLAGLNAIPANILSETLIDEIDLAGIGRLIALTPNDEVNSLAALHFSEVFGKNEVYQLPRENLKGNLKNVSKELQGLQLFGKDYNHFYINRRIYFGAGVKKTRLTKDFDFKAFKKYYGKEAVPMFLITESKKLLMFTSEKELSPKPGQTLISLVDPVNEEESK